MNNTHLVTRSLSAGHSFGMSLDLNWWNDAGCDTTIWTNVYLSGAPDRLYKKVFQNPRMRGDGGLAWRREARKLCIITVRPPPVARWVFGPAWFLHMFHVIRHGKPVVFKPKNKKQNRYGTGTVSRCVQLTHKMLNSGAEDDETRSQFCSVG